MSICIRDVRAAEAWQAGRAYLHIIGRGERRLLEIEAPTRADLEALRDAITAALDGFTDYDEQPEPEQYPCGGCGDLIPVPPPGRCFPCLFSTR